MKRPLLFILLFLTVHISYGQAYVPMPANSATWRYRITDIDYITQVLDNILFLNGEDTIANGNTYHKIFSRTCKQTYALGTDPPFIPVTANGPDFYFGAIRESGRQVFLLAGSGEQLIFDFTVAVDDSIPAYTGKDKVTDIDSVLIGGVYHKRYLTTDTTYFVIEGIGSNRGIIPGINDGGSDMAFICLTDTALTWSPDTTLPCAYVYPMGYVAAVQEVNSPQPEVSVFPVPADDVLHVTAYGSTDAVIVNCIGKVMWHGVVNDRIDLSVRSWPHGLYYMRFAGDKTGNVVKKIVVY